jgi:hypothetical protein
MGARTREALEEAICQALLTITAADAQGGFGTRAMFPLEKAVMANSLL